MFSLQMIVICLDCFAGSQWSYARVVIASRI